MLSSRGHRPGHSRAAGCVATQVIASVYNEQCVCVCVRAPARWCPWCVRGARGSSLRAQRSFQREPTASRLRSGSALGRQSQRANHRSAVLSFGAPTAALSQNPSSVVGKTRLPSTDHSPKTIGLLSGVTPHQRRDLVRKT